MKKFVVYITLYSGTMLPKWYIGSSYEQKIVDGYNGTVTSKKYKNIYRYEQKHNKHLFKTRILSHHKTRKEAYKEENRLQIMHKVVNNEKYYNKSYANENFGENNSMFGRKHTDRTKKILSKKLKELSKISTAKRLYTYSLKTNKELALIGERISNTKKNATPQEKKCILEKWRETMQSKTPNGLTIAQIGANKAVETKKIIQDNGKTIHQNAAIKAAKTRNKNQSMHGLNHPKCKKIYIYCDNILLYECEKSFKTFCVENELKFGILNKAKLQKKPVATVRYDTDKKYIGWEVLYEKRM